MYFEMKVKKPMNSWTFFFEFGDWIFEKASIFFLERSNFIFLDHIPKKFNLLEKKEGFVLSGFNILLLQNLVIFNNDIEHIIYWMCLHEYIVEIGN